MPQKSISGKDLSGAVTSDDMLGKDVIDSAGSFIGVSEKVFIDPSSLDFIGISVDKGFLRKGLLIGKDYIDRIAPHAIFLKIRVAYEIINMLVFDKDGKKVGSVVKVELLENKNQINALYVSAGAGGRKIIVPFDLIENIGYNVVLKATRDEVFKSQ